MSSSFVFGTVQFLFLLFLRKEQIPKSLAFFIFYIIRFQFYDIKTILRSESFLLVLKKQKNNKIKRKSKVIYTWVLFEQIIETKDFKVYEKTLSKENENFKINYTHITHELNQDLIKWKMGLTTYDWLPTKKMRD